jgi:ATP-dependent RNA helicase DDX56/DBP9
MNGNINILLSTRAVIDDLNSTIFKESCLKQHKKKAFELYNMTTIITCNLAHLEGYHEHMTDLFHSKPFIMTFIENTPK